MNEQTDERTSSMRTDRIREEGIIATLLYCSSERQLNHVGGGAMAALSAGQEVTLAKIGSLDGASANHLISKGGNTASGVVGAICMFFAS
jgi:hypothetical protein